MKENEDFKLNMLHYTILVWKSSKLIMIKPIYEVQLKLIK